jgi:antitoxin HigA-1
MAMMHNPPHPGEILRDWLAGITIVDCARALGIGRVTLSRILNGAAAISAEMDIRLEQALGTSSGFWLKMQAEHDLWRVRRTSGIKVKRMRILVGRAA